MPDINHLKIFDTARCQEELKSLLAEAKSQKAKASEHQRWGPLTSKVGTSDIKGEDL